MSKAFIFVSCGQYTPAEKTLGKHITTMVKSVTGVDAFFAEEVQDLQGLDTNILAHLRDCSGFITVLHPRGRIIRPDRTEHVRASVWIEQEIAIVTYITRVERRTLPVIAFIHRSVGREGIRDLLHLNPIAFTDESEILAALPELLKRWGAVKATGIVPQLKINHLNRHQDGHPIRQLVYHIVNNSDSRITQLSGTLRIPAGILKHWSGAYGLAEEASSDPAYRIFRFDETNIRPIQPRSTGHVTTFDFCISCAIRDTGETDLIGGLIVAERQIELDVWVDGKRYKTLKTLKELSQEGSGTHESEQ